MNTPFAYGDKVLLLDLKQRRYLITLAEGAEFHSHNGYFAHSELVGQLEGIVVKSTKGSPYTALRPTLEDFVVEMPRGAQVIYPKDLAPMCMLADIGPGVRVLESGVGSGALSMTMLRWGAEIVGYELREDFANRAKANVRSFLGEGALERYHVELRDCYDGIDERGIDRVVLDLPEPWQVVPHADGGVAPRRHPHRLHAIDPAGVAAAQRPGLEGVERHQEPRGAASRLVRRGPGGAPRPPHGRPHRLPHHRPLPRLSPFPVECLAPAWVPRDTPHVYRWACRGRT